jgi:hypothetical protein
MNEPDRDERAGDRFAIPMIVGMLLGVVVSSMTGAWWWVGVGLALGAAVGAAFSERRPSRPDGRR